MAKITDSGYSLLHIIATEALRPLITGTTEPYLIRGVDESSHQHGDFVIKPMAFPRMSAISSMRELLASFIAMQLEINIPEPALVNITDEFAELLLGRTHYQSMKASVGIAFGSRMIDPDGYRTWLNDETLPTILEEQALEIFIFDMFIQNVDRGGIKEKPNLLTNGEDIYVIDHELAFSYIMAVGLGNNDPWLFTDMDRSMIENHLFFPYLRGQDFPFSNIFQRFTTLDRQFWQRAEELIPDEWLDANFNKISNRSLTVVNNIQNFETEIRRILL